MMRRVPWENLYWDGIDPELVGAVQLASTHDEETLEPSMKLMVEQIQKSVKERGFKVEEFWVTRMELDPDAAKDIAATTTTSSAAAASKDTKIPNSNNKPAASSLPQPSSSSSSALSAPPNDVTVAKAAADDAKTKINSGDQNSSNNQATDKSSSSASPPPAEALSAYRLDELVIFRLWHEDVFFGARASGKANPGEKNCDYYFHKSGVFVKCTDWTTTDEMFAMDEE